MMKNVEQLFFKKLDTKNNYSKNNFCLFMTDKNHS